MHKTSFDPMWSTLPSTISIHYYLPFTLTAHRTYVCALNIILFHFGLIFGVLSLLCSTNTTRLFVFSFFAFTLIHRLKIENNPSSRKIKISCWPQVDYFVAHNKIQSMQNIGIFTLYIYDAETNLPSVLYFTNGSHT